MKLENKVAMIAGCSPNIGAGVGLELAKEGAKLVCIDLNLDFARACANAVTRMGGSAIAVKADVTKEQDVVAAVREAEAAFGGIDILFNGGAVIRYRLGLLDMSVEQFRQQVDVILSGAFLFSKHVAQSMIRHSRAGVILYTISTEGHQGDPGNIGYATAKSGLLNFTRSAAMELAPYKIRVNSITPTGTDTSEAKQRAAEWGIDWKEITLGVRPGYTTGTQGIPLGKRPSPSHYGKAAVFLASDDAEMITGFDLRVDGGVIAKYWRWNPGATIAPP